MIVWAARLIPGRFFFHFINVGFYAFFFADFH